MIATEDIGRVCAAVLQDPELVPEDAIEIAGDELTGQAIAEVIAEVAAVPARYEALPWRASRTKKKCSPCSGGLRRRALTRRASTRPVQSTRI